MKYLPILFLCLLTACTDGESAKRVLTQAGYSSVETKGYVWLACGKEDIYHTEFIAKGPTGANVSGVVCKGIFKGSTIRLED